MSKDYAQIANDVVTGIGLLRQGAPDTVKAFGSLSTWWGILSLGDIALSDGAGTAGSALCGISEPSSEHSQSRWWARQRARKGVD